MICKNACAGSVQSEKYERQCLGTVIPKTIESRCKMLIEKMNFIVKHSHFCHVTWIFTNPMRVRALGSKLSVSAITPSDVHLLGARQET